MLIIGICGASGSGKSTLAKSLASRLEKPCVYIKQDSYYKDHPDMSYEERCLINYDEPEIFEHETRRCATCWTLRSTSRWTRTSACCGA